MKQCLEDDPICTAIASQGIVGGSPYGVSHSFVAPGLVARTDDNTSLAISDGMHHVCLPQPLAG